MRVVVVLSMVAALFSTGCRGDSSRAHGTAPAPAPSASATTGPIEVPQTARDALSLQRGFAPIVVALAPAVVAVSTVRVVRSGPFGNRFGELFGHDFFGEQFFPEVPRERREQAQGSGVVVSEDGYVLTNNHVVEGASEVRVSLQDRRELRAKIVGTDPKTDIAVLKIDGEKFAFVPFGDSSKVRVGEFALAVGNPFAIGQTVTLGIISAVGRGSIGIVDYEDFIQTDAAINPGNSGGALVNASGELIGINTAILARGSAGNQGIGFAVPAQLAHTVMDRILKDGRVIRGWMGVGLQDITPAIADALGRKQAAGVLIGEVVPGSPADRAGVQRGDVVLQVDGETIVDSRSIRMRIAQSRPGTKVRLHIERDGKPREVTVPLGELPDREPAQQQQQQPEATGDSSVELGIAVVPLTDELRARLQLPRGDTGVVVSAVDPGSAAERAGLRPGDVILEVDRRSVKTPDELRAALAHARSDTALLLVSRRGRTVYLPVEREAG